MILNSKHLFPSVALVLFFGVSPVLGQTTGAPNVPPASAAEPIASTVLGKPISLVKPPYPREARERRISGRVDVLVLVDAKGAVTSATVLSGDRVFAEVCQEAALQARFSPTLVNGSPVATTGTVTFSFGLNDRFENRMWFEIGRSLGNVTAGVENTMDHHFVENRIGSQVGSDRRKELFRVLEPGKASVNSARAQALIESIQTKLGVKRAKEAWFLSLGVLRSRLERSASDDAKEGLFRLDLARLNGVNSTAPADIPEPILSGLRRVATFGARPHLTMPERQSIVGMLIERCDELLRVVPDPSD